MHSPDGERWFSDPRDIRVYLMRKEKTEAKLHPRLNLPMTRF